VPAAGANGAIVNWTTPAADDDRDGAVPVVCAPSSGSLFAIGSTTVTCTATDLAGNLGSASFVVTVLGGTPPTPTNHAPLARGVVITTTEGVAKDGVLAATDADGDPLTFSLLTAPAQGVVVITDAATGAFTYIPNRGAIGYDSFTFEVSDGHTASSATASVFIVANSPRWPGQTVRASVASGGIEQTVPSNLGAMPSADGRFIAFTSGNLDTLDVHVFVHDRQTGQTELVSKGASGEPIPGALPWLTPDGRYVAYTTLASSLPGNPDGSFDIALYDRVTGQTTRVSVSSNGTPGNGEHGLPSLSADGRYVAFFAASTNLAADDTDDTGDIYLHDRQTGETTLQSVNDAGVKGLPGSWRPILSADGRFIAFNSEATNLVPNDTNGTIDVFVRDVVARKTTRVSVGNGGAQATTNAMLGGISADGRFVLFGSDASNLVAGDTNGFGDLFVRDRQTGQTTIVSVSSTGELGNGASEEGTISADGRYVVFRSWASNLVPGDTNGLPDEFVHDRLTGRTVRVNVASDGSQADAASRGDDDGCCIGPAISADGRSVVIFSRASNLVPDDTNDLDDVFVVGPVQVSPTTVSVSGSAGTHSVNVTADYPGPWTATTATPWITINSPAGGTGTGTVSFTVAANTGPARTGTLVVALQPVTVTQGPSMPPVAQNSTFTTPEDTPLSGTLLATDPNGDALTFSIITPPARGTAVITNPSTGAFTYSPGLNRFGGDTFTFQVSAGGRTSNIATVIIDVTPVDDAPVAFDSTLNVTEDTPASSVFSAADIDNLATMVTIVTPPAHGTVTIPNPIGGALDGVAYTYTPHANYHGPDSFTFRAGEGSLVSNIATITVSVAPVNDAPVADIVVVTTQEGVTQTGTLTATDVDSAALTFSLVAAPTKGTIALIDPMTGAFTYTPNPGASGYDTFTFQATDGLNASSAATGMVFIVAASPQWPGQTVRASVSSAGVQGSAQSSSSVLSADGRYVVFQSQAANLVADDTNGRLDVFVHDRETHQTTRVSVASNGSQSNGDSFQPRVSPDGRFVAFTSQASNLVAGDTNGWPDVFIHDRETGQTVRASISSDGTQGDQASSFATPSADGRYVAFLSSASNLVPDDTNGVDDVFVRDLQTGQTARVSVSSTGAQANDRSVEPAMSADGRYVAFTSFASNLTTGDSSPNGGVFVHDRQSGETTRVSAGLQVSGTGPSLSADGRFVAFALSGNDVFVVDRLTGQTQPIAVGSSSSLRPQLSADGRFVSFSSSANLVPEDTNGSLDAFVFDRQTNHLALVSVANDGSQGNNGGSSSLVSADGRFVAVDSLSSTLVASDTNGAFDVFVVGGVSVGPATFETPGAGGSGVVNVSFGYPGTPWTATTTEPWITIDPPAGGTANGSVGFTVAPNLGPARTGTLVVGLHTVTVTQAAFVDVVSPTVTPPAPITVYATGPTGATQALLPALAQFLAGATAVDNVAAAPVQQPPQLNGAPILPTTVFALGANTVTFRFTDAAGNVGTGTSIVTVLSGRPALSASLVGTITNAGQQAVTLRVNNTGAGNALNLNVALSAVRTLTGTGAVTVVSGLPASAPLLGPGQSLDIPIVVNVPSTVQRFALTEGLTMADHMGASLSTTATQTVIPVDDVGPTITLGPSITVTSTSMTITWTTDEPATSRVDWGVGTSTNRILADDGVYVTSHSKTLTGLVPNTMYSVIVSGHDRAGNIYQSSRRTARANP
jgi:Tol biopolymer transport system component